MAESARYRDRYDRETEAVAWKAPDGRQFFVCGTDRGFALRSPDDWESDTELQYEADAQGNVYLDGERTGWRIPQAVLQRTGS